MFYNPHRQNCEGLNRELLQSVIVREGFVKANDDLQKDNLHLKGQLEKLQQELVEAKAQQVRAAKPIVDLTHDCFADDSDIEIIEESNIPQHTYDKEANSSNEKKENIASDSTDPGIDFEITPKAPPVENVLENVNYVTKVSEKRAGEPLLEQSSSKQSCWSSSLENLINLL